MPAFFSFKPCLALTATLLMAGMLSAPLRAETLTDTLVAAYLNNPTLKASRAALRAVDEGVPQALSGYRPSLSLEAGVGKRVVESKSPFFSSKRSIRPFTGSLNLSQNLYEGGQTQALVEEAEFLVEAQRASLHDTQQQVLLSAVTAHVDILRDKAVLDLNLGNEQVLRRQLEATGDRFEVGEVTRTDVSQAQARLARATAERTASQGTLVASRAAYRNVVGDMPGTLEKVMPPTDIPGTLEEAIAIALDENPEIIEAQHSERAALKNVRAATGALLPSIDITGQLSRDRESSNRDGLTENKEIMAQLTVPLYQSGSVSASIRQAKQIASQRLMEIEAARRNVIQSTTQAWEDLETARAQISSFRLEIEANTIALTGVEEEAQVGARTVLDILDAEQELLDSKVALVRSQREEMIASYALLGALGRLTVGSLGLPVAQYDVHEHYDDVRGKFWGINTGE